MMTPVCRGAHSILVAAMASGWAAGVASAQPPVHRATTTPTPAAMTARIPVGDVVYVTDTAGTTFRGELGPPTDDAVRVKVRSQMHEIPAAEVRRVRWQQPDSLFTGVAIGAAIGAVPGLYYLAVDPNECRGMCPEEYTLIVIGAVVGGVIDRAITRKVTVYSAEPAIGARRVTIGPLLMRARTGVQLAVSF